MATTELIGSSIPNCRKVDLGNISASAGFGSIKPVLERYETALLFLVGFAGISVILALLHRFVRKHVYNDVNNVDTAFDAGGRVSTSLTAVTVASQFLWPGDILQSSTIAVKSGISGPLWYTVGAALNIALFPIVSVYLKTRAPGAKTFLQIIKARYGKPAHVIFVILALLVNFCVISAIIVAGVTTIQSYTIDASDEFCVMIIAVLFGSYSFIGGLGTTFYVSYFNAVLIFSILIALNYKILYSPDSGSGVGSISTIYEMISCIVAPEGNEERSYFSFQSQNGLVWAFMGLCATASLTYCDQAAWQSRIAAKPLQGVLGFLIASYIWFSIPISISTSAGLAYLSMAMDNMTTVLSPANVDAGLVTPFMTEVLLGEVGGVLIVTMIAMMLMSTGSGEVMAVSSIIVYDIYQVYVNPFRKVHDAADCILCNKPREKSKKTDTACCTCPSVFSCEECKTDAKINTTEGMTYLGQYRCQYHGLYRQYQERMLMYKSWCILWVTIAIVPLGLGVMSTGVDLNWIMLNGFIATLPCFPPVVLSIFWSKTSRAGVISGSTFGVICGISVALGVASTYEGGLNNFLINTTQNNSVMAGAATSIGVSFFATLLVSCGTHNIRNKADVDREWLKLRNIDNPLHPWSQLYVEDIPSLAKGEKPSVEQLDKIFRKARIVAYIGGIVTVILFVGIVPGVMLSLHVLTLQEFETWTLILQIFCLSMAAIVVIVAPVEEIIQICRQRSENKKEKRRSKVTSHTNDVRV